HDPVGHGPTAMSSQSYAVTPSRWNSESTFAFSSMAKNRALSPESLCVYSTPAWRPLYASPDDSGSTAGNAPCATGAPHDVQAPQALAGCAGAGPPAAGGDVLAAGGTAGAVVALSPGSTVV